MPDEFTRRPLSEKSAEFNRLFAVLHSGTAADDEERGIALDALEKMFLPMIMKYAISYADSRVKGQRGGGQWIYFRDLYKDLALAILHSAVLDCGDKGWKNRSGEADCAFSKFKSYLEKSMGEKPMHAGGKLSARLRKEADMLTLGARISLDDDSFPGIKERSAQPNDYREEKFHAASAFPWRLVMPPETGEKDEEKYKRFMTEYFLFTGQFKEKKRMPTIDDVKNFCDGANRKHGTSVNPNDLILLNAKIAEEYIDEQKGTVFGTVVEAVLDPDRLFRRWERFGDEAIHRAEKPLKFGKLDADEAAQALRFFVGNCLSRASRRFGIHEYTNMDMAKNRFLNELNGNLLCKSGAKIISTDQFERFRVYWLKEIINRIIADACAARRVPPGDRDAESEGDLRRLHMLREGKLDGLFNEIAGGIAVIAALNRVKECLSEGKSVVFNL